MSCTTKACRQHLLLLSTSHSAHLTLLTVSYLIARPMSAPRLCASRLFSASTRPIAQRAANGTCSSVRAQHARSHAHGSAREWSIAIGGVAVRSHALHGPGRSEHQR